MAIIAYARRYKEELVLVVNNLSSSVEETTIDLAAYAGRVPHDLVTGETCPPITREPYRLRLAPFQFYWLDLARS